MRADRRPPPFAFETWLPPVVLLCFAISQRAIQPAFFQIYFSQPLKPTVAEINPLL